MATSNVNNIINMEPKKDVILKMFKHNTRKKWGVMAASLNETLAMKTCAHTNVVTLLNTSVIDGHLILYIERASCTLRNVLNARIQAPLSHIEVLNLWLQLLKGVESIHNKHVIHRDLKPENIMMFGQNIANITDFIVKIGDFGLAVQEHKCCSECDPEHLMQREVCSLWYRDPALMTKPPPRQYDAKLVDMWSMGCILCETLTGIAIMNSIQNEEQAISYIQDFRSHLEELSKHQQRVTRFDLIHPKFRIHSVLKQQLDKIPVNSKLFDIIYNLLCKPIEQRMSATDIISIVENCLQAHYKT